MAGPSGGWTRRGFVQLMGSGALGGAWIDRAASAGEPVPGRVAGQPQAAVAGEAMLRAGGNAVDAMVTAAFVAGVVSIHNCGIGGYGGHAVIALPDGKKVTAIDFNTT